MVPSDAISIRCISAPHATHLKSAIRIGRCFDFDRITASLRRCSLDQFPVPRIRNARPRSHSAFSFHPKQVKLPAPERGYLHPYPSTPPRRGSFFWLDELTPPILSPRQRERLGFMSMISPNLVGGATGGWHLVRPVTNHSVMRDSSQVTPR